MRAKSFLLFCLFLFAAIVLTAQNDPEAFIIKTKAGNFLPDEDANLSNLGNGFSASSVFQDRAYQLIQFYKIPSETDLAKFKAAGIRFLNYVPNNAYIASLPVDVDFEQLEKLNIRTVTDIPSIYKLNGRLLEELPEYASDGKQVNVVLNYYEDISIEAIYNELLSRDLDILDTDQVNKYLIVSIPVDDIIKFSDIPFVEWIDLIPEPGEAEDLGGQNIHRSNAINNQLTGGYRFDGEGVKVLVRDDGLVGPHIDYAGRLNNLTTDATGTHGDGVAGVMSGGGNLDPAITGMAPGSEVYVINYNSLFSADNTLSLHQNDDVKITNSSYSNGCNAGYTTTTEVVDDQTFQNPTLLHVFSAGNSNGGCSSYGAGSQWGNITGGHKIGKNVIATANLFADGSLVSSSSRGPAADGRLKPDISAHGQGQLATNPNNAYQTFGGTSAAAPGIAGVSAQLYQAYKAMNNGIDPEAALIKATLLNTADELGNLGPDFKFGWGRVNGLKALKVLENGQYLSGTITNAQDINHLLAVPANVKQVKVMVYWAEPAPAAISGSALINDLDIKLTTPNSTEYLPWVLDVTPNPTTLDAPAVRGIDRLNNVEQVTLDDPTAGNYTLSIKGTSVPVGPQKYYLVYDFIYDEITVTYPLGGEGVVPNTTERIHWDAFGTQGNFLLEYTTDDGANWTTIATVNGIERLYLWTIPSTITGAAKVRVSRGTNSDESDQTFSIIGRPTGIEVAEVCADRIRIIWNNVAGATGYDVFMLGQKTMEVVGSSTQSSYEFTNIDPFEQYWVAVRATGSNGLTGRRSNAISINEQTFSCALPNDLLLSSIITPGSSVNTCFSSAPNVSIKIRNQGQNDVPQFTASYQLNGGNIVTETISTPLASSGETTYTFSAALANYTANTTNNLRTWVTLVDDDFRGNDTLSTAFYVSSGTSTLPSVTNFNDQNNCATSTDCEGTSCSLSLTTNWQNATNGSQDDVDWRVNSGITFSQNTGPTNDFDLGTSNGKYLYLETSGNCNQKVAQLISSCIDLGGTNSPQFYFYYHMYGSAMGELHVDLFDGTTWIDDINVPVVGNQGDDWYPYTVDLSNYKSVPILLRIRGITGNDFTSDIAIDYIGLREQGRPDCARIDFPVDGSEGVDIGFQTVAWRPAFDATGYRLKIGTTSGGDDVLATTDVGNVLAYDLATILSENTTYYISVTPYNSMGDALNCVPSTFKTGTAPTAPYCEDVEEHTVNFSRVNQKGWQSFTQNTYRWLPDSGGTPSSGTGPTSASSGTNYFYTEASGASTGDTILLYAPTIDISQLSSPILTFDYHMYGGAMGTLRVDAFDGSQWQNNIWSISGQQQSSGNEAWRTASITLPTFSNKNTIRLRFFARRGNSYTSDIAIDDICVVESPPPPCVALQTPSSGENLVSTTVTLSWAGQASADGYFLKIGTMPDGDDFLSMTDIGATTSYQPATPFDYLTTYYVTLLGYNGQGIASNCAASYFKTIYDSGIRECGTVKAENYCYGNSSEAQFPYTSGDPTLPLKIDFLAGKLEVPFDSIKVYDGVNTAANLLYGGNNNGDLTGLTLTTTGSDLLVVVKADESVSCASQSTCCNVPLQWEVGRIEAGGAGLSSDCECDPSNPNHQHLVLDGSREGNPQIVSRVYHANVTIESKGHVLSADTVHFKAGSVIDLNPGFDAQMGSIFEAEMAACDNSNSFRVDVLPVAVSLEKPASTSPIIKVYPNPFQATLNIALHLNLPTKVNLNVYDQLGKQVAVITPSTNLDSGVHTFLFSGDDLLGGIYFLTLDAPSGRIVKKIIKM